MLFTLTRKVLSFLFNSVRWCLPSWLLAHFSYLTKLLPSSPMLQCSEEPPTTATMDDYPERAERLEPLKTLHETRANDQYGEGHDRKNS